ncbi:hypothetical protein RF11_13387 [Thelohanellus kitauei]|uniref:Uncharacterized protein n=1 Tax=Thelohanellus kitauei TaxID=669202 RepID=A0A0C2LZR0_THEKT|nr:hypothetical protein RF11_13387 [Thelohanellus kitauei]
MLVFGIPNQEICNEINSIQIGCRYIELQWAEERGRMLSMYKSFTALVCEHRRVPIQSAIMSHENNVTISVNESITRNPKYLNMYLRYCGYRLIKTTDRQILIYAIQ